MGRVPALPARRSAPRTASDRSVLSFCDAGQRPCPRSPAGRPNWGVGRAPPSPPQTRPLRRPRAQRRPVADARCRAGGAARPAARSWRSRAACRWRETSGRPAQTEVVVALPTRLVGDAARASCSRPSVSGCPLSWKRASSPSSRANASVHLAEPRVGDRRLHVDLQKEHHVLAVLVGHGHERALAGGARLGVATGCVCTVAAKRDRGAPADEAARRARESTSRSARSRAAPSLLATPAARTRPRRAIEAQRRRDRACSSSKRRAMRVTVDHVAERRGRAASSAAASHSSTCQAEPTCAACSSTCSRCGAASASSPRLA